MSRLWMVGELPSVFGEFCLGFWFDLGGWGRKEEKRLCGLYLSFLGMPKVILPWRTEN